MREFDVLTGLLVIVFGFLAFAFILAAIADLIMRVGAPREKTKEVVAVDVEQLPTIFHLSDGSTARDDVRHVQSKGVDPLTGQPEEQDMPRKKTYPWLFVGAAVTALVVYWLGHPWTMGQCLMEASKRPTIGGVATARSACAEMFP